MTPTELCPALLDGLIVVGLAVLIALVVATVVGVRHYLAESRQQQERIARQQVALHAEAQLRESTQSTMRAMREAIRQHNDRA